MLEKAREVLKNVKNSIKAIPYNIGVMLRRAKFFFTGLKNNPPSARDILNEIRRFFRMLVTNPSKYIPAAKIAAYFASLLAVVCVMIFTAAQYNSCGIAEAAEEDPMLFPGHSGFLAETESIKVKLNWTDGIAELNDGKATVKLNAEITPNFFKNLEVKWKSSDETIASVSKDGTVTAKKTGTVYITSSVANDRYTAKAKLRVIQPVTGLFMKTSNVTLYTGGSGQYLKVQIYPENATETELKWESKNTKVATVTSAGRVKPEGVGVTEVTASTKDGKYSCKAFITVVNYSVQVGSVSIKNDTSELKVGESLSLVASVSPSNAKNKTLIWSTSDEKVASVSQTGRVKAVGEGNVTITARAVNGVKSEISLSVLAADGQSGFDLNDYSAVPEIAGSGGVTYTPYTMTLPGMVQLQMGLSPAPKIWKNGGSVNATEAEVAQYMNPSEFCDSVYKYQFLDLSVSNGISVDALNAYLADKGVLAGQGQTFKDAAERYNVSEIYLAAHAALETGNGTSQLSTGVEVNGVTVYNMFGIGAYDNSAVYSGSQKAYSEGWTSVEAAIEGGAEWISKYYINSSSGRQNTLYKMLFNPDNPGQHQYATDISWAVKQAETMSKIFAQFPDAVLSYNIPVYSGQTAPEITEY